MNPDHPSPAEVRAALQRVTSSEVFRNAPQLVSFLTYVVERSLVGEAQDIKGYTIATQALGRPADFDPQSDPIVRVEAGRLRRALDLYYAGPGQDDSVRIRIPRGTYVPKFERVEAAPARAEEPSVRPAAPETSGATSSMALPEGGAPAQTRPGPVGSARRVLMDLITARGVPAAAILIVLSLVLGSLIALGAGLIGMLPQSEDSAPVGSLVEETKPIVAVAPVELLGAAGISPEAVRSALLDVLARFDELDVVDLAGGPQPWSQSGYLLSVSIVGSAGEATARLTHLPSAEVVWTRTFELARDAPSAEIDVARRIGTAVAQPYGVLAADLRRRSRIDERTRCILMAHAYWREPSQEAHAQARDCLEAVVDDSPDPATALASLAMIYLDEYRAGRNPRPHPLDRALAAARRAIEIEPESSRTNLALMAVLFARGDTQAALTICERLIALNPHDTNLIAAVGSRYVRVGRYQEGMELIQRAAEANPAYPPWYDFYRFLAAYMQDDLSVAKAASERIVATDYALGLVAKIAVALRDGRPDEARALADRLVALQPEYGRSAGDVLSRWGFNDEILKRLVKDLQAAGLPA